MKKGHVLSFILLLSLTGSALAQTRLLITAEADVYVLESLPEASPSEEVQHVLSAGIGSSGGRSVSYIRFDLTEIPNSNFIRDISIDSGYLRLLAQSFGVARAEERFLVTVSYCLESAWSESAMTWNSRVCKEGLDGEDSVIIDGKGLPQIYMWDVTRSLAGAKSRSESKITFVLDAIRLRDNPRDIVRSDEEEIAERIGLVRFWSRERGIFGISAVPTLVVSHSSHPTALMNFLNSMLAVLSAIGVTAGIYEVMRKTRSRGIG